MGIDGLTFKLFPVQRFDARRGYVRCSPPGLVVPVGASGRSSARADLWRDSAGRLVVRLRGGGDTYSYEARLASGETIPDAMLESATDWLSDVMAEWIIEGLDDAPDPSF